MFKKKHLANMAPLSERQRRIWNFLNKVRVGVLTSVDPNGNPHGSVIYYTLNNNFNISFLTKTETKKSDNLIRNNHVMLVVFDPVSQGVVQVTGKTMPVSDNYEINRIAAAVYETSLRDSEGGVPPIAKLEAGDFVAFQIIPYQIRMALYARPDSGGYDKIFESIESFEFTE